MLARLVEMILSPDHTIPADLYRSLLQFNLLEFCRNAFIIPILIFSIESSNLDGSDRRVIISGIPHIFGISLMGSYIYWTDWVDRSVKRAGKYNGGNPISLIEGLDAQPMDIKVFAKERQDCK